MHLAIFTSEFPSKGQTYFMWDLRSLLDAGFEITIFPVRPIDPRQWEYLSYVFEEKHIKHLRVVYRRPGLPDIIKQFRKGVYSASTFATMFGIDRSAIKFGIFPFLKNQVVISQALCLLDEACTQFDHVLAYWGNYAATYAYLFHKWSELTVPFSILLHAGTDLYRDQVYLDQKLLFADNIFTVCEFNIKFIQNLYPDLYPVLEPKLFLHQLGLDLTRYPCVLQGRERNRILAVGRLEQRIGFDYLLMAVSELQKKGQDFCLEIVGSGPDANKLQKLARQLGVADKILFTGWLSMEQVKEKMQNATLLVHPSPGIGDAVPTVIKEAMASGLPVVASYVAGIPELLNDGRCGLLVPPANVKALALAIQSLLENEPLRMEYARLAREHTEAKYNLLQTGANFAKKILQSSRHQ